MSEDVKDKVRDMAKLALASNRISEVQEKNLKMYPFVFFNGVKAVQIEYDFTNDNPIETEEDPINLEIKYRFRKPETDHFRVAYHINIAENVDNPNMEKRFKHLERAVRTLFWKETAVEIHFNGSLVYKSVKNVRQDS